ncbi:hypothetical protein F5Y12DRAFT_794972 [Xylaria sp. FL1777]|nr:hypothetical protein F5Y12DRAFT_794972 [Xylaria sp. FL1777]
MPSLLKDCVVSIAGDLDDPAWKEEKVRQWVQYWGGKFSDIVDNNVTHLLCTEQNFRKKTGPVKAALKNKVTKVVVRDWLEDSINRKVRLKTLDYQLDEKEKKEVSKKRKLEKMKKCSSNAKDYIDERFWHVYRDSTYFEYQIQLTRIDEESGNVRDKHVLTLWESNAKPYNYVCTTLFTKSKHKGVGLRLHDSPVDLDAALEKFKSFFKKKANIAWDNRVEKMGTMGPEYFQYQPPSGGKPVGLITRRGTSILGEKPRHNNDAAKDADAPKIPRKRPREHDVTAHTTMDTDDTVRSAKQSRRERVETARMPVQPKASSPRQVIIIISDSESEEGGRNDLQSHVQNPSDEPVQDATSVHRTQREPGDLVNGDILQSDHRYEQEPDSSEIPSTNAGTREDDTEKAVTPCTTSVRHKVAHPEVEDDCYTYNDSRNAEADAAHGISSKDARSAAKKLIDLARQNVAYNLTRVKMRLNADNSADDY